jgi:hypothetical protein
VSTTWRAAPAWDVLVQRTLTGAPPADEQSAWATPVGPNPAMSVTQENVTPENRAPAPLRTFARPAVDTVQNYLRDGLPMT